MDPTPLLHGEDVRGGAGGHRCHAFAYCTFGLLVGMLVMHARYISAAEAHEAKLQMTQLNSCRTTTSPPAIASPPNPSARVFPPSPPVPLFNATYDGLHDVAVVVFTRHGERSADKVSVDLTPEGYTRAMYLGKCVSDQPSVAFPFGAPTRLLASLRDTSKRPVETLTPLARRLGLVIETADLMDIYALNRMIPTLEPRDQLLVSWQHWFLPRMIAALYPPSPRMLRNFPEACNTSEWTEPQYAREGSGGDCYDIMWQLMLVRPKGQTAPWQAVTFNQMHQGFGGASDSPCMEALAPIDI